MSTAIETSEPQPKRPMHQMSWDELSGGQRENLVQKYGEPITIEGANFQVSERQIKGSCDANEKSLAALAQDRKYWGYYGMTVVNDSMVSYWLEMHPRMISTKVIKGSEGGMILPGMIYTESDYPREGVSRIQEEIARNGTRHVATPPQRGDFTTVHLPEKRATYMLTPIRYVDDGEVHTKIFHTDITDKTVDEVVMKATIEALENEDELYRTLHNNMSAYFDNPENPELVKRIRLQKPITPIGEINMPVDEVVKDTKTSLVFEPGREFDAIQDPVSWNNSGNRVFIINANSKYYFCPADDCDVIE